MGKRLIVGGAALAMTVVACTPGVVRNTREYQETCKNPQANFDVRESACEWVISSFRDGLADDGSKRRRGDIVAEYLRIDCDLERSPQSASRQVSSCMQLATWAKTDTPTRRSLLREICVKRVARYAGKETLGMGQEDLELNVDVDNKTASQGSACRLLLRESAEHPGEPGVLTDEERLGLLKRGCDVDVHTYCRALAELSPDPAIAAEARARTFAVGVPKCEVGKLSACTMLDEVAGGDPKIAGVIAKGRAQARTNDAAYEAQVRELDARSRERRQERREERREENAREAARDERQQAQLSQLSQAQAERTRRAWGDASQALAQSHARPATPAATPPPSAPPKQAGAAVVIPTPPPPRPPNHDKELAACIAQPITPMRASQTNPFMGHAGMFKTARGTADGCPQPNGKVEGDPRKVFQACIGMNAVLWPSPQGDMISFGARAHKVGVPFPHTGEGDTTRQFCITMGKANCLGRIDHEIQVMTEAYSRVDAIWGAEDQQRTRDAERTRDDECKRRFAH